MPIPMPRNASWRDAAGEAPAMPPHRVGPSLAVAVAAIVAVAAQRARGAGTLDALRTAVLAALADAEQAASAPRTTPDAAAEDARLRALFGGTGQV